MAQSQTLLIILGLIIVGIAVVLGVRGFKEGEIRARKDRIVEESMRIAATAALWKEQTTIHGGGRDVYSLTGLTLGGLGHEANSDAQGEFAELSGGFYRLYDLTTDKPYIQGETREGDLVVRVYILGRERQCFIAHWTETGDQFPPKPDRPGACTGWEAVS